MHSSAKRLPLLAAFLLLFLLSFRHMADSDLFGHLACGNYYLDTGHILTTHHFNCSWPDFTYVNHSWLFQAVVAVVERAAGEPGLIGLQVGLLLLAFWMLYRLIRLESDRPSVIAFVLALGTLASMHRFSLRPQHFTYVFLLFFLYAIRRYQNGSSRAAVFLPPVMLLWVNMHAEALWGVMVLGTFLIMERLQSRRENGVAQTSWHRLVIVFGAVLAAAMINPFTYKTVFWPFFVMKEQFAGVQEILPPTWGKFLYFWIYCSLVVITTVFSRKRADPFWMALVVLFLAVAWTANRGIPHFVFVSAPLLAGNIDALIDRAHERFPKAGTASPLAPWVLLAALVALMVSIVTSPLYFQKFDNVPYPEGAVDFLKKHRIRANVINEHMWGGYIIWKAYPDLRPYIDGRFFHRRFYDEYYPLLAGQPGWEHVLERYGITAAILTYSPGRNSRLNDRLFRHPDWRLVYWDDVSLLYVKATMADREVVEKYGNEMLNVDRDPYNTFQDQPRAAVLKMNVIAERNLTSAGRSAKAAIVAGNTWFALGEHARALDRYTMALDRLRVPNPGLLYHMALCHRARGDLAETEEYLRRVLEIAPEAEQARSLMREVRFLRRAHARKSREEKDESAQKE